MAATAPVLWDVVEEHLDEAAFLWSQWEAALASPRHTLASVANGPEARLVAHLDGLLVAGAPAQERVLLPALAGDDAERAFAAALALLEGAGREGLARVVERLAAAGPPLAAAITRALALTRRPGVDPELLALARSGAPASVGPALEALAFRAVPVAHDVLLAAVAALPPDRIAPAVRAARLAGPRALGIVDRALGAPPGPVLDAALETGLLLGLPEAWTACVRVAETGGPGSAFPLLLLALGGEPSEVDRLAGAARDEALRPAALTALAFTGRAAAVDACLPYLRDPKAARLAAEAISTITGLAVEGRYQAPEPPPPEEPVPLEQDDLDANLVPGPDALLRVPAADALEGWWSKARAQLDGRARCLGGEPWTAKAALAALAGGSMRRRRAVALDLAVRTRGEWTLETRTWAEDQRRLLAERPLPAAADLTSPLRRLVGG
jgi:uncharacterized protein (TIGR02270 family)